MPISKPPPSWFYRDALTRYEATFRRKTPQWVLSLGPEETEKVIKVCLWLQWKLPPKRLISAQELSGPESLWAQRQTRHDFETELITKGRFKPRDLQDLPVDPVEMIGRFLKKLHKKDKTNRDLGVRNKQNLDSRSSIRR